MTRRVPIRGRALGTDDEVVGQIDVERQKSMTSYVWRLETRGGVFAAQQSRHIDDREVPDGQDPIEYAIQHAMNGINRYRILRKRAFEVEAVE